jgi:hypothetical protein
MKTQSSKPRKVRANLAITKEAQDVMLDNGYCGVRGMGEFLSQLVVEHHARVSRKPTQAEIAQELHKLASLLEEVTQYSKVDNSDNCQNCPPDEPMPLANVIDAPSDMVGVTVISEESGEEGE